MPFTLRGRVDVNMVAAYAPTAEATPQYKDSFYGQFTNAKRRAMRSSGTDMNAHMIHEGEGVEERIGKRVLGVGQEVKDVQE